MYGFEKPYNEIAKRVNDIIYPLEQEQYKLPEPSHTYEEGTYT